MSLFSPIKLPIRVAAAKPIANGNIKTILAILSAIAWPARITSPSLPIIIAAPENMLISTKIPTPIGVPNLKIS